MTRVFLCTLFFSLLVGIACAYEDTGRPGACRPGNVYGAAEGEEKPAESPPAADKKPTITPTDRKSAAGKEATEDRIKDLGEAKSPEESLKTIHVPKGFKVELVACEPLIVDPVAFDWGPDGRLWVVEMRDYPRGLDDKGEAGGRVKVLSDKDGDGKYDEAALFADGLPFPTGIKVWRKGVIVTAAPDVLYFEDTDGDGQADEKKTLLKGFGEGNQQHRVNGLRWGMDGWLYLGNGDSGGKIKSVLTGEELNISGRDLRFKPDTGEMDAISGATQYSLAFDDFGNRFGGNNSQPVWHYVLEDYYLRRNPAVKPPAVKREISVAPGAAEIFPLSKTVTRFNDYHAANRFTSACGIEIYRDQNYFGRGYYGNSFVCEPVHNLVHRESVQPMGVTFRSRRTGDDRKSEFLASTDNWFRPVMVRTGPDGALYVADMYRMVIEHPTWIPVDWQEKIAIRAGDDKGRIYRVVREDRPPKELTNLEKLTTDELASEFSGSNGTRRDLIQQMLIWKDGKEAVGSLRKVPGDSAVRVHALRTIASLRQLAKDDVLNALQDKDSELKRHAMRLAERYFPFDVDVEGHIFSVAQHSQDDSRLALQSALSLGLCVGKERGDILGRIASEHSDEVEILTAVLIAANDSDTFARMHAAVKKYGDEKEIENTLGYAIVSLDTFPFSRTRGDVLKELFENKSRLSDLKLMEIAVDLIRKTAKGESFGVSLDRKGQDSLRDLTERASKLALDPDKPVSEREVALALLLIQDQWLKDRDDPRRDFSFVPKLLALDAPESLRKLTLKELAASRSFPFDSLLWEHWYDRTQQERREVFDALVANENASPALAKLLDGDRLMAGDIDRARSQQLSNVRDPEVIKIRDKRGRGALIRSDRAAVVRDFEAVHDLRGDVARGRAAFRKRCTACHQQEGIGKQIGPDLAALTDRSPQALLTAMLDPNRAVEAKFVEYLVITNGGLLLTGVVTSETGTSLTLVGPDGKEQTVLRKEIELVSSNKKSLMPEGLERDLSKQEFADIIAYLCATAVPPKKFEGNAPALVKAGDDGALALTGANARIYGPKLVFEDKYKNLGFWQSEEDFAEWSLQVPAAGKYKVTLDYAADASAAGDTLQISIGGQTLLFKVASTGTWDDYTQKVVGTVELAAGPAEATARSIGAIESALIDLRGIKVEAVK